ncbi:MAG TPA: ribonuclease D, partial [Acidimicrobiales bacterium]|nr:ribonuclease D [Acidimicrobiales bacterium]
MSSAAAPAAVVVDLAGLESLVAEVAREDAYAFDTEFHTERTYVPELALIQIAWADKVALVDPLAVDPAPLAGVFGGPGVAVAHASKQDLDVLMAACGVIPATVFDTQIVAGFLGMSTPSLSRLVDVTLGVSLPKADRLSDWLERPMSDRQIAYAISDVAHLLELRAVLTERLRASGRLGWALNE